MNARRFVALAVLLASSRFASADDADARERFGKAVKSLEAAEALSISGDYRLSSTQMGKEVTGGVEALLRRADDAMRLEAKSGKGSLTVIRKGAAVAVKSSESDTWGAADDEVAVALVREILDLPKLLAAAQEAASAFRSESGEDVGRFTCRVLVCEVDPVKFAGPLERIGKGMVHSGLTKSRVLVRVYVDAKNSRVRRVMLELEGDRLPGARQAPKDDPGWKMVGDDPPKAGDQKPAKAPDDGEWKDKPSEAPAGKPAGDAPKPGPAAPAPPAPAERVRLEVTALTMEPEKSTIEIPEAAQAILDRAAK